MKLEEIRERMQRPLGAIQAGDELWYVKDVPYLLALVDELAGALDEIVGMGTRFDPKGSHSKRVVEVARTALAKVKGERHAPPA